MARPAIFTASIFFLTCAVGGCGMVTPDIQEFWGTSADAGLMEAQIVHQVSCELMQAVRRAVEWDMIASKRLGRPRQIHFLSTWNAQLQFTLIVDEKSTFAPAASFTEPLANAVTLFPRGRTVTTPQFFHVGGSLSYSNQATRTDKIFITYKIADLLQNQEFNSACLPQESNNGVLFVQSDLKLADWLTGALNVQRPSSLDDAKPIFSFSLQKDALSHGVRFEITTSGGINPNWKLVQFGTENSPLFSGSRERTQELVITMGPPDQKDPNQLGPTAQTSSLASQITTAISAGLRRPF